MDNLRCWETVMAGVAEVQFLLFLDCTEEVMKDRLLERGKTSGRSDDNLDSIVKRFRTYEESTRPIIDYFDGIGLVKKVDSTKDENSVFDEVAKHFA
jgi:adenylate kinase family enzyme